MSSNNSVSEEKMLGGEPKALVKAGSDSCSEKHTQALQRQLDEALVRVQAAEAKAASLERDLAHAHKRRAELEGEAKMRDAKLNRDFSDAEASSDEESESEEEEGGEWVTCANCKHKTCVEDLGDVCEFCAEDSDDEFVAQGDEGHFDDKKRKVPETKDEPQGKKARTSFDL